MTTRLFHHLVAYSLLEPEPVGCAPDYETAACFVQEMGRGIISLHIRLGDNGPCPICEDGVAGKIELWRKHYGIVEYRDVDSLRRA